MADFPIPVGKYKKDPITEKDIVTEDKISETCSIRHLIYGDASNLLMPGETSVIPDVRINLPLTLEMPVFEDDVFLIAYPKTGSHWLWEVVSMLMKGSTEYEPVAKTKNELEFHYPEEFSDIKRPRVFNTHFLMHHLPKQAIEKKCRMIAVQRNPKDTVVSMYHHVKSMGILDEKATFSDYFTAWLKLDCPAVHNWFYHTKKSDEAVNGQNDVPVYNVYFEDMKADPVNEIKKMASYLKLNLTDDFIKDVADKCSFKNLKKGSEAKETELDGIPKEAFSFMFRKGEVGDWKNYFTVAQNELFDQIYKDRMKDIKFTYKYSI